MITLDLQESSTREVNRRLHGLAPESNETAWRITNPKGAHSLAAGLTLPISVEVDGHVGYYCAGMNKEALVTIKGHAGQGLAENIMSGTVRVTGNASQAAAASGHGGLVVIEGDASSRCGISMKGVDIVVGGSVGHMSAFMAQAGHLVVCGDAGPDLGDSIYEAVIYLRGKAASLGSDCVQKEMTAEHRETLAGLLKRAEIEADPKDFRRYGSARQLYNFKIDNVGSY